MRKGEGGNEEKRGKKETRKKQNKQQKGKRDKEKMIGAAKIRTPCSYGRLGLGKE